MAFLLYCCSVALVVLAQWLDYASTRYAEARGAVELNPLVRTFGLVPMKMLGVVILSSVLYIVALRQQQPHFALRIALYVVCAYLGLAGWNMLQAGPR